MPIFLKSLVIVPLLLSYGVLSCAISLVPAGARTRRKLRTGSTPFFARWALILFGVRVHLKHHERLRRHAGGRLIVANHVSYADVLVIASLAPSVFITSVELKHTPLLGALARFGGCLFVERRKASGLKREIEDISKVLGQGFNVILFPEGTTSNGERVQPFKNSLFDAAVAARADVLPLCLRYTGINSKPVTNRNKDSIFYYGGVSFRKHFPRFLSLSSIDVHVLPLRALKVHGHASRKELAGEAHQAISAAYSSQTFDESDGVAGEEPWS